MDRPPDSLRSIRIARLFLPALILLLLAVPAANANHWEKTVIAEIGADDGSNAIAVINGLPVVAYIKGMDVMYATYDPLKDTWTSELIQTDIPSSSTNVNQYREIKLVDWNGKPAIAWMGRHTGMGDLWAVRFAYKDTFGWHVESVWDEDIHGFDLQIGPGSVPYISMAAYHQDNMHVVFGPVDLYHRTGANTWVGEWVTETICDNGDTVLAFDNGLPRVAYYREKDHNNCELWYAAKNSDGSWQRSRLRDFSQFYYFTLSSLTFTSDHRPFILGCRCPNPLYYPDPANQYFALFYSGADITSPDAWSEETPFVQGNGLLSAAAKEFWGGGTYYHITYFNSLSSSIGYIERSPTGYGTPETVASGARNLGNVFDYDYWNCTSPAGIGPHIAYDEDNPVIVYQEQDGSSIRLVSVRALDPPEILSISPSSGQMGTNVTTTLTGNGFLAGAGVRLVKGGKEETAIHATNVVRVSSTTITCTFALPYLQELGDWDVIVTNPDGRSAECLKGFRIEPPSLSVTSITPNSGTSGRTVSFNITGTGFVKMMEISLFSPEGTGHTDTTTYTLISPTQISCDLRLPDGAGVYSLKVISPDNDKEAILPNAFTVLPWWLTATSITPNTGVRGSTVTATIKGSAFVSGATVTLKRSGSADITARSVIPRTEAELLCTFDLPSSAAAGAWTVRVRLPDGQSANIANGFTITEPPSTTIATTATTVATTIPTTGVGQVPGGASVPRDLNTDGKYEDVNGNGRRDFADVTLYFNQMTWIATNEPLSSFDYNGNGRIDFADVTWLFDHL
jgi:PKD repeat protein